MGLIHMKQSPNCGQLTQVSCLLSYPDIVNYLVLGCSAYTLQDFKSYKSLEAHMQFTNGWVQEMKVFVPDNCDNVVVLTKVSSTLFLIIMVTPA